jgi:PIN domain nuclease of toxin-antitoxin system
LLWEIAIKHAAGTLRLDTTPALWFPGLADRYDLRELPLDARTACAAAALPPLHRDPFDRVRGIPASRRSGSPASRSRLGFQF